MPRGEEREPKSLWKLGPDGIWRHPDGWEPLEIVGGDIVESLRAMRDLCAFLPDVPPEPITTEDDAFARENWHIKVTS